MNEIEVQVLESKFRKRVQLKIQRIENAPFYF